MMGAAASGVGAEKTDNVLMNMESDGVPRGAGRMRRRSAHREQERGEQSIDGREGDAAEFAAWRPA